MPFTGVLKPELASGSPGGLVQNQPVASPLEFDAVVSRVVPENLPFFLFFYSKRFFLNLFLIGG